MHQNEVIKYQWSRYPKYLSKLTFMQIRIVRINAGVIFTKAPDKDFFFINGSLIGSSFIYLTFLMSNLGGKKSGFYAKEIMWCMTSCYLAMIQPLMLTLHHHFWLWEVISNFVALFSIVLKSNSICRLALGLTLGYGFFKCTISGKSVYQLSMKEKSKTTKQHSSFLGNIKKCGQKSLPSGKNSPFANFNKHLRYQIVRFDHVSSNDVNIFIRYKMVQIHFVDPDGRLFICGSGFLGLGNIILIYLLGKKIHKLSADF